MRFGNSYFGFFIFSIAFTAGIALSGGFRSNVEMHVAPELNEGNTEELSQAPRTIRPSLSNGLNCIPASEDPIASLRKSLSSQRRSLMEMRYLNKDWSKEQKKTLDSEISRLSKKINQLETYFKHRSYEPPPKEEGIVHDLLLRQKCYAF